MAVRLNYGKISIILIFLQLFLTTNSFLNSKTELIVEPLNENCTAAQIDNFYIQRDHFKSKKKKVFFRTNFPNCRLARIIQKVLLRRFPNLVLSILCILSYTMKLLPWDWWVENNQTRSCLILNCWPLFRSLLGYEVEMVKREINSIERCKQNKNQKHNTYYKMCRYWLLKEILHVKK